MKLIIILLIILLFILNTSPIVIYLLTKNQDCFAFFIMWGIIDFFFAQFVYNIRDRIK